MRPSDFHGFIEAMNLHDMNIYSIKDKTEKQMIIIRQTMRRMQIRKKNRKKFRSVCHKNLLFIVRVE